MKHREHHPRISIGLFFIVLGLALLAVTNDVLNLGGFERYFTWETALIFIGVLLIVNLNFIGGLIMTSIGTWFLLDKLYVEIPEIVRTMYWPGVIILAGISFIISSLIGKYRNKLNQ
ncbi:MAG: DUF5668 domain-containing protein [Bacteroidales bacterium]